MLEVAITSIKCALRDDYPDFREFYENRAWEKRPDGNTAEGEDENADCNEERNCNEGECKAEGNAENDA